jgi:sarcosine oxidase subunit alpha
VTQPFRLPGGGRIDQSRPVHFTFDGRAFEGFAGDTLASALLANGVHLVARSFKYHRPRGIMSAGPEEPNALVEIDRGDGRCTPNLRATQVELYDGLVARSQNRYPSLAFDLGAVNRFLAPLLPAGFYYKTFMWPAAAWKRWYEPIIRAAAGLGRAPAAPDPDRYANRFAHCDVLVIGAGPAGLAAASAAAASGARVIVCDEQADLGGSLLADDAVRIGGLPGTDWIARRVRELVHRENVTVLRRTTAFGYYAQNFVALAEQLTDHLATPPSGTARERLWQVRAREVILATGAIERPLVFPDNDRPGIMLAGAARTYATRYGVRPGSRAVLATTCDSAYRDAIALQRAGVEVVLIADLRDNATGPLVTAAYAANLRIANGVHVLGTQGGHRLRSVDIGHAGAPHERIACDLLCMSGGWTPSIHLYSQARRGKPRFDAELGAFVPGEPREAQRSAGACRGVFALAEALADGQAAGIAAAEAAGGPMPRPAPLAVENAPGWANTPAPPLPRPERGFVDFANDVTVDDLRLAAREGFRSIEHVKRYTTTGMAPDQGKTSNMNALAIVAETLNQPLPDIGLTTFRPPYTPVSFGTFAGHSRGALFDPVRTTPMHEWAAAQGAVFEDVGAWKRARFFPRPGEDMHAAVQRECATVRASVGLFDGSTLGKIEVVGPNAAEFLNRMYVNDFTRLSVGRCRYGIMLGENGFVLDDGVIGRLAPDRFHVTTTTGGAACVLALMEDYLQTEWSSLRVWLTSVTEQWAVLAVQGPRAREVLEPLMPDANIGAMPHMSVRAGEILGVPMRLFRVSFTGETGYEINVPADYGTALCERIWERVHAAGGTLYGTETMHVLRAEKGYLIVGQETDGTATIGDVGLEWAIGKSKRDFVGRRSLARPDMLAPDRKQLVGLLTDDPQLVPDEGSQITEIAAAQIGTPALGHVTSSYASATLGRSIMLAMVAAGRSRHGATVHVQLAPGSAPAKLVSPVFYDAEGARLNG